MQAATLVTRTRRWTLTLLLIMTATMPVLVAKNPAKPALKITFQEAVSLQKLLQPAALSTEAASP